MIKNYFTTQPPIKLFALTGLLFVSKSSFAYHMTEDIFRIEEEQINLFGSVYFFFTFGIIVLLLLVLIYQYRKLNQLKKEHEQETVIKFERLEVEQFKTPNVHQVIIDYVGSEYHDPDLSLTQVSSNTGIGEKNISKFFKDEFNMSFKQYLNNIRLEEAKRLIESTNLSFKEITYMVGYGSTNHFTRVFKQYEAMTPTEYKSQLFQLIAV